MKLRRWTPWTLLQASLGAALLLVGGVVSVMGFGVLMDHYATVPRGGVRTRDPWAKATIPAVGVSLTGVGACLFLGYPRRRHPPQPTVTR